MDNNSTLFSQDQLLEVLTHSENATAIYSTDKMIIQFANDAMIRFWGKDPSVIGKSIEEALPELADQPFKQIFTDVMRTGVTYASDCMPAELVIDGERRSFYFDFKYTAIKNGQGETYCVLNTAVDVTSRYYSELAVKEAEEREQNLNEELAASNEELAASNEELAASNEELVSTNEELSIMNEELRESSVQILMLNDSLRDSEDNLSFAIDAASLGTWDLDPSNMKFAGNERLRDWFGLQPFEQIPLGHATDVILEQDRERVKREIQNAMDPQYGGHFDTDYTILNPLTKIPRKVRAKGKVLFNEHGTATRFSGTLQDITEEERTREALVDSKRGLELALAAAKLGSYDLDLLSGKLTCSEQCKMNYGLTNNDKFDFEELLNVVHPDYKDYLLEEVDKAVSECRILNAEYPVTWPDGAEHWLRVSGQPHYDYEGKAVRITGVSIDITEQRRDDLRKNDFIGMVSHELKTPLTSLKGYVQVLQSKAKKAGDESAGLMLGKVNNQVNKMNSMINGFLSISRLESGKILLVKQEFELAGLINETIEENTILFPGHRIVFDRCDGLMLYADRDKIGHVISNLISNAAKYSALDSIIEISCVQIDNMAVVTVKDYGMGIPKKDHVRLFERYYRVESTNLISGFGIGLYLSAEIIERHHGKIWVESELEIGSTFHFSLPLL